MTTRRNSFQPTPQRMKEVAPNTWVQLDLNFTPAEMVLCDVVDKGDGTWKLEPRSWENLVRVDSDLCQRLGLGSDTQTMRRLIRAGFVFGARISPKVYNVNLAAFFRHLERCAEDPDFWQDPKRLAAYRETMF